MACATGVPAQGWVTLIVGGLAAIGVIVTWQRKNLADKRSEWWRAQRGLAAALGGWSKYWH
jgi:hypothetical protein